MVSGHIYFVPVTAKIVGRYPGSDTPTARRYLKRDLGNTERSLCDVIQLQCVNILLPFV